MKHVVLVDMRYFGNRLLEVRHSLHLNRKHAAKLLGMEPREYSAYERGRKCLPEPLLQKMLHHAFVGLSTKYALTHPKKK